MARRGADFLSVVISSCIVSVRNSISVSCAVPQIWLGVSGNAGVTSKKISACPLLVKKLA